MFGRLSWQLVYQSDVLIGARRLGSVDIGAYSVALQLATLPMQRIMGVINQVVLPAVARLQDERERLRRRLLEGCRILTAFSVPVLWGMSATSPEIVGVALGPKWSSAVLPLQLISLVVPLRMVSAAFSTANLGIGRAGTRLPQQHRHGNRVAGLLLRGHLLGRQRPRGLMAGRNADRARAELPARRDRHCRLR